MNGRGWISAIREREEQTAVEVTFRGADERAYFRAASQLAGMGSSALLIVGGDLFVFDRVVHELEEARRLHGGRFMSLHEAYAVLLEEVAELFEIVRQKHGDRDPHELIKELAQIAAVAVKTATGTGLER